MAHSPTTRARRSTLPRFPDLTDSNRDVFDWSMSMLDGHADLPLFWMSAKSTAWYCTALLARGLSEDIELALRYIENILTQQYTQPQDVTYGTYKDNYMTLWAHGDSLAVPKIYDTYDPNNALFITIAFIFIDANFPDLVKPLLERMRQAMYIAVQGDEERVGGINGDNLRPCYTNPWFMRIVCTEYVGRVMGDDAMVARSTRYLSQTMDLFDRYHTISEFNSPTYTGVTLLALGVTQYLPKTSVIRATSSRIIQDIWREVGMTYNASLTNLSGAWDRTYGYDMTLYVSGLGAAITNAIGMKGKFPLPNPLAPSFHLEDAAGIPIMCLIAPYLESYLPAATLKAFTELEPHSHIAQAFSPPFDKSPRRYTYYVGEEYSVGGIEFDENVVGGPSINLECFAPGVVLWDTGNIGSGVGWISYVPTSSSCSIIATASSLTIRYPPPKDFLGMPRSNIMRFHISTFPDLQLKPDSFSTSPIQCLPGMNISLSGNVIDSVQPTLSYTGANIHGWQYYVLEYQLPWNMLENESIPELVIGLEKVAVKSKPALYGTKMPSHHPTPPTKFIINDPPIQSLNRDYPTFISTDHAEKLISIMRERLVSLRDETGEFLYRFEDGSTVDTKGWYGWDWTQGIALTALIQHFQLSSSSSSSRSLEVAVDWFEAQYKITDGKGAPKNINTMSVFYSLASLIQNNLLKHDQITRYLTWVEEWMGWLVNGLPRTQEGGFQHVTYESANHDQLWDDTLFMTCLPLARASILLKRPDYMQFAIMQFLLHTKYLGDTRTGLWFHGWQFGGPNGGSGHNFAEAKWGRGNCWVTLAIPMFLELIDEAGLDEKGVKTYLTQVWNSQVRSLLRLQNTENGMWHTLLDDPSSYVETSATAGIVAGIFMSLRLNLVEPALRESSIVAASKGLSAIIAQISPSGEVRNVSFGTAMGHDLQFYRDIPLTSMPYGQALAILALVEFQRWKR